MKCLEAKPLMSLYLDSRATSRQSSELRAHLSSCSACSQHYEALRYAQSLVSQLGRKSAPPDLALKLRIALSQELAKSGRSRWETLRIHWENVFHALMVPATGGLVTTILTFGLLINLLMPIPVPGTNDVPTTFYTPPQLETTPFELTLDTGHPDPLIVEAMVGADGRVQDYRILSGNDSSGATLSNLKNMLIFATFRPATSFGRPTAGRTILAFSRVQVAG